MPRNKAVITEIIRDNNISSGMSMKNVSGEDLPDTIVLGTSTYAWLRNDIVTIVSEDQMSGESTVINLIKSEFEMLQNWFSDKQKPEDLSISK